jgi:hypothetical protein
MHPDHNMDCKKLVRLFVNTHKPGANLTKKFGIKFYYNLHYKLGANFTKLFTFVLYDFS